MKLTDTPQFCPSCGSKKTIFFHDNVWTMKDSSVYRCEACQVTFIHPMLTPNQEKQFYENYNEHVKARGVSTSNTSEEFHKKSQPIAQERFAVIRRFFKDKRNILEIGSSTGAFLQLLDAHRCTGVEPATENRNFCKNFTKHLYGDIKDIPLTEKFDIICMFHVFEHIRTPQSFLAHCKKLLHPDGLVIIEVPHIEDPLISLYNLKEFKDFYFQPMHPFVHSVNSLRFHFETARFAEEEVICYQRYGLDNHLAWLANKKAGGDSHLTTLFKENTQYKQKLVEIEKTDTIFYIARNADTVHK